MRFKREMSNVTLAFANGKLLKTRAQGRKSGLFFAARAVAFKRLMDRGEQIVLLKRLGKKFYCPGLQRPQGHRYITVRGNENDGNLHAGLLQLILKIETVHSREADIQHQATRRFGTAGLQEIFRRAIDFRAQPHGFEESLYRIAYGGVIVDYKYFGILSKHVSSFATGIVNLKTAPPVERGAAHSRRHALQ